MRNLLLIPLFVYTLILRHEGSHALVAWLEGAPIKQLRLFPGYREDLGFFFGYVAYGDGASWITTFSPFVIAMISVGLSFFIIKKWEFTGFKRDVIFWLGILSPLVDLAYNYFNGFWRPVSDVAELLEIVNPLFLHIYFIGSLAICFWLMRYFQSIRDLEKKDLKSLSTNN